MKIVSQLPYNKSFSPLSYNNNTALPCFTEYEHPVEAVQAISMLNGQLYYDRKMSVRMDRAQDSKKDTGGGGKLPQGLKGLGMGLGINGSALTDVTSE